MPQYNVFNNDFKKIGSVEADNEVEALQAAKNVCTAPILEKVLSSSQQQQKKYDEMVSISSHYRSSSY